MAGIRDASKGNEGKREKVSGGAWSLGKVTDLGKEVWGSRKASKGRTQEDKR